MEDVKWTAQIEVLSPLHVGTGAYLLRDVDWLLWGNTVYVASQDALLEAVFERAGRAARSDADVARAIAGMTLKDLVDEKYLTPQDFTPGSPLFRYSLPGRPATNRIHEQVKDVRGRPYLPGSSLKGALRTVLVVGAAREKKIDVAGQVVAELERVKRLREKGERAGLRREEAALPVERALLAPGAAKKGRGEDTPHYDLLRALQVGDSEPVGPDHLTLLQVQVYPTAGRRGGGGGLVIDAEALRPGTLLRMPVRVEG
ncbi:MAG: type III-A CRISPR-associated RAMP protein Csm5, partial [Anaerolineae bacterium]